LLRGQCFSGKPLVFPLPRSSFSTRRSPRDRNPAQGREFWSLFHKHGRTLHVPSPCIEFPYASACRISESLFSLPRRGQSPVNDPHFSIHLLIQSHHIRSPDRPACSRVSPGLGSRCRPITQELSDNVFLSGMGTSVGDVSKYIHFFVASSAWPKRHRSDDYSNPVPLFVPLFSFDYWIRASTAAADNSSSVHFGVWDSRGGCVFFLRSGYA